MILLILGIIALIVAVVATVVGISLAKSDKTNSYGEKKSPVGAFVTAAASGLLGLVMVAVPSVAVVGPTDVAIPVAFGNVGDPMGPGVHIVAPWTSVESYPTRPVTVEVSGEQTIIARTADAGQMKVEVAARWKVDPAKAKDLYMQVRTGDDERISNEIVVKNLRQSVGEVYSRTANLDAVNDRTKVTQAIQDQLQEQLDKYGITVEDINLRSVEPDDKTAATIASFAAQQQATRIAEEAKKTAQIEAQRRLIEAEGLKAASQAVAGISGTEAEILCMQVWQQTIAKAIDAGQPVYTSPCGAGQATVAVPAKQ